MVLSRTLCGSQSSSTISSSSSCRAHRQIATPAVSWKLRQHRRLVRSGEGKRLPVYASWNSVIVLMLFGPQETAERVLTRPSRGRWQVHATVVSYEKMYLWHGTAADSIVSKSENAGAQGRYRPRRRRRHARNPQGCIPGRGLGDLCSHVSVLTWEAVARHPEGQTRR